jgi:hypothetical protein
MKRLSAMKKHIPLLIALAGLMIGASLCTNSQSHTYGNKLMSNPEFKEYWYTGEAEISRYDMQEIRYGEVRDGNAVLVFVTEDFLTDKQVKLESPRNGRSTASVLKLNFMKEFITGIYKYNMMTAVFTPVGYEKRPRSLKVQSSSQEWCGMTYFQLNLRGDAYDIQGHSYFEQEGDYETSLDTVWLEDELWTKLRLSPNLLPTGDIEIIPGAFSVRQSHSGWTVEQATARLEHWKGEGFQGDNLMAYTLDYKNKGRTLTIVYEKQFPHKITGWEETQMTRSGDTLTARSVRTHTINTPYWKQNATSDEDLRKKLGLRENE